MTLGEFLKTRREVLGLSTRKVEEMCGVSDTFISLLENGKRAPSPETLKKLSGPYQVSYYELLQYGDFLPEHAWLTLLLDRLRQARKLTPEAFAATLGLSLEDWQQFVAGGVIPEATILHLTEQLQATTLQDLLQQGRS
ncbi:helix-turn-helix domain-containing protein [Tumebacillus permanentifrigoris]|uniref:Transcriptional regulator with XRE-family HTH domain n=1 Tax=Tumebacillus permanentifrigoris TaxID=378543 RepID=A0A316D8D9_9BACL|nr:helix-turn-helix transcriptional regulator [Tumebacillus permanentifrigoris]PWK13113.1 transcriptional regulator with XRE-family HTH domain [Tumebacillus permanentifrigoris]